MAERIIVSIFSFFFIFANTAGAAWVDADGVGQESSNISISPDDSVYPIIVTDQSNNPHVVWNNLNTPFSMDSYYLYWNGTAWADATGSGRAMINASGTGLVAGGTSIRVDPSGTPYLAWGDAGGCYAQKWNGSAWVGMDGTAAGRINYPGGAMGGYIALEPGTNYVDDVWEGVNFTAWNGSSWSVPVIADPGGEAHIQIDTTGKKHILYADSGNVYYVWFNGVAWVGADGGTLLSDKLVVSGAGDWSHYFDVDSLGTPYVVYEKAGDIFCVKWNGSAWTDPSGSGTAFSNVSNSGIAGRGRLAMDPAGQPNVVYDEGTNSICFLKWNGSSWADADNTGTAAKVLTITADSSAAPWIAVSDDGTEQIVWTERIGGVYQTCYLKHTGIIPTPTFTRTCTPVVTPTITRTNTPFLTPTATRTFTPVLTPTITPTNTPVFTPTASPTYMALPTGDPVIYPNPYCPETAFNGTLKVLNIMPDTTLLLYTLSGELVISLSTKVTSIFWDGKNGYKIRVSPGIYYYMLTGPKGFICRGKLFIIADKK